MELLGLVLDGAWHVHDKKFQKESYLRHFYLGGARNFFSALEGFEIKLDRRSTGTVQECIGKLK